MRRFSAKAFLVLITIRLSRVAFRVVITKRFSAKLDKQILLKCYLIAEMLLLKCAWIAERSRRTCEHLPRGEG